MAREFILTGFGLDALQPAVYRRNLGEEIPVQSLNDFPQQEAADNTPFNIQPDGSERLSWLGSPVFSDLEIREDETGDGLYLDTILIDISQEKQIIRTAVQGRSGTIKEYIADGDYTINLKGAIVNHGQRSYPEEDVAFLSALMRLPQALFVASPFLQLFGIQNMVVASYSLPQKAGFQNVQLFEINAYSDEPVESLILNAF